MPTKTEPLIAYHGDPALKKKLVAKIKRHRLADRLAKGAYVRENGKKQFCAVGCLLEDPDGGHERYESEFGIPTQLAYLEDSIFESLPNEQAILWPERFMKAIGPGADLSNVWPQMAIWLMIDETWGVANTTGVKEVQDTCRRVAEGYQRAVDGKPLSDKDAEALARAVWAARDAWDVRAARAARAARDAWDVRDAWAVWAAWDAWDVRDAFVAASADKLIELLLEAA